VVVEEEEAVAAEAEVEAEDHPVEEQQRLSHKSQSPQHKT
jgi:hypothetical protein